MQEETFQRRYAILEKYHKENGNISNIKSGDKFVYEGKKVNLTSLINNLRLEYKKCTISQEYVKKFEDLGMIWKVRNKSSGMEERFAPLIAYYHEFGDLSKITSEEIYVYQGNEYKIGALVRALRRQYKARDENFEEPIRPLTDKEVMFLEQINFKWNQFFKNNQELINQAKCYYDLEGSLKHVKALDTFNYNGETINIGNVIMNLRKKYANRDNPDYNAKLTQEQIKELEDMGMIWKGEKSYKHRLDPLIDYYNNEGSLKELLGKNVWYKYNGKQVNLGVMAYNLRRQYVLRGKDVKPKDGRPLTDEEVELLKKMEFPFSPIRARVVLLINVILAYYKENGTANDIDSNKEFIYKETKYNLADVMDNLKKRYKEREVKSGAIEPLLDEDVKALEDIGIDFKKNPKYQYREMHRKHLFDKWCKYLTYYYQNYGSLSKIKSSDKLNIDGEVIDIGNIIRVLRHKYKSRQKLTNGVAPLTDKEVALLESMGMEWSNSHLLVVKRIAILKEYYKINGSLNKIKTTDNFIYQKHSIPIGRIIVDLREYYKNYLTEGEYFNYKDIEELNKMGMVWNKQPNKNKIK